MIASLLPLLLSLVGASTDSVPTVSATEPSDTLRKAGSMSNSGKGSGLSLSGPIYLESGHSSMELQLGYQTRRFLVRMDLGLQSDIVENREATALAPSLGLFYIHRGDAPIRIYEGIVAGYQEGLANTFHGKVCFVDYVLGMEFLPLEKTSGFIEIGTGAAFPHKPGAYDGGTILGGGLKTYFRN